MGIYPKCRPMIPNPPFTGLHPVAAAGGLAPGAFLTGKNPLPGRGGGGGGGNYFFSSNFMPFSVQSIHFAVLHESSARDEIIVEVCFYPSNQKTGSIFFAGPKMLLLHPVPCHSPGCIWRGGGRGRWYFGQELATRVRSWRLFFEISQPPPPTRSRLCGLSLLATEQETPGSQSPESLRSKRPLTPSDRFPRSRLCCVARHEAAAFPLRVELAPHVMPGHGLRFYPLR